MGRKENVPYKLKTIALVTTLILCCLVLIVHFPEITLSQRLTIAIFIFAALFWAFEIIPLYATSIIIVLALTLSLAKPNGPLGFDVTGYKFFLVPFSSPVIMLFLGGFVLALAVNKHSVDEFFLHKFMRKLTNSPKKILFGYLFISALFSMWLSNTATAAIMITLAKPIIDQLHERDPFKKGVALSIAFGANIGGICTPIGTPPNAIAIGILAENKVFVNFLEWMIAAVPLAIIILVITGYLLIWKYPFKSKKIPKIKTAEKPLTKKGISVLIIAALMIFMWLTSSLHKIPEALIALLGVGAFAAFQLINVQDLRNIQWDILILMWGGLALGQAFQVSEISKHFFHFQIFKEHSFILIAVFCFLALIISSFISNTATANFILPIAISVPAADKMLLAVTVALSCSFAMSFPVSTPPNAIVYSTRVLKTKDFFHTGSIISFLSVIIVLIGFEFIISKAFSLIP